MVLGFTATLEKYYLCAGETLLRYLALKEEIPELTVAGLNWSLICTGWVPNSAGLAVSESRRSGGVDISICKMNGG